jgi:hypothetical protein
MLTVWKFPLAITDQQQIEMPVGAEILHVEPQEKTLCLWARVDPDAPLEGRAFVITGTGNPVPEVVDHVGSAVVPPFVWHVWEER